MKTARAHNASKTGRGVVTIPEHNTQSIGECTVRQQARHRRFYLCETLSNLRAQLGVSQKRLASFLK